MSSSCGVFYKAFLLFLWTRKHSSIHRLRPSVSILTLPTLLMNTRLCACPWKNILCPNNSESFESTSKTWASEWEYHDTMTLGGVCLLSTSCTWPHLRVCWRRSSSAVAPESAFGATFGRSGSSPFSLCQDLEILKRRGLGLLGAWRQCRIPARLTK